MGQQTTMSTHLDVGFIGGESYEVAVRGHRVVVDQPTDSGGGDTAATPTELFIASLATCVAFYAGRYLSRHGYSRDGLSISADYEMAADRPARVSAIRIAIHPPADLPAERRAAFLAVASHCTVHNSITQEPEIAIEVA